MEVIKDCKDDKAIAGISRILRCMTKILNVCINLDMGAASSCLLASGQFDAFWTQATANLSRAEVHPLKPFLARYV